MAETFSRARRQRFASRVTAAVLSLGASVALLGCAGGFDEPGAGAAAGGASGAGSGASGTGTGAGASTPGGVAFESVARRLSSGEIDNVLRDVLGDETRPAARLLLEDEFAPYDNDYTLQQASQALIDGLESLAEDVARRALAEPARRARLVPCAPAAPDDAVCFRSVVETLGRRLFRRPLRAEEVTAYLGLLQFATEDVAGVENDFYTAVDLFLRSVLQDPEFIYRIEVGTPTGEPGTFALDGFELASRLAFAVWGSAPDDRLLADAEGGALATPAGRRAAVDRLLADARAREQLHRFHAMWLGYRAIPHPVELTRAFQAETTALIDRVVFEEGRSYLDLFTLGETFADASLAAHYGLPAPASGSAWVEYGADRAGILSHGSVLAAFSKFSDTSPTQRGILVRARLLCEDVPSPPANVDVDQPPQSTDSPCKSARYEAHRAVASCASCHAQIDPIGFGLENYDIGGRFREHDEGLPECPIDGRGALPGVGDFSGPGELGRLLAGSGGLDACTVRQYLTYTLGRRPALSEAAALDGLVAEFRGGEHDLAAFVGELLASDAMALRKEPP